MKNISNLSINCAILGYRSFWMYMPGSWESEKSTMPGQNLRDKLLRYHTIQYKHSKQTSCNNNKLLFNVKLLVPAILLLNYCSISVLVLAIYFFFPNGATLWLRYIMAFLGLKSSFTKDQTHTQSCHNVKFCCTQKRRPEIQTFNAYYAQVQGKMATGGCKQCDFFPFCTGRDIIGAHIL